MVLLSSSFKKSAPIFSMMGADLLNKEEEAMISFVKLATLLPETN